MQERLTLEMLTVPDTSSLVRGTLWGWMRSVCILFTDTGGSIGIASLNTTQVKRVSGRCLKKI